MPAPRTSNASKAANGTLKPSRVRAEVALPALGAWPEAPGGFSVAERAAWGRLGAALMLTGAASEPDTLFAAYVAQVMAMTDRIFAKNRAAEAAEDALRQWEADGCVGKPPPAGPGGEVRLSTLNSLLRLLSDLMRQLGLSPKAREGVQRLPDAPSATVVDELDEF